MFSRLLKLPKNQSFFLFGARGTGKTFWLRQNFGGAVWLDLLETGVYSKLLADPSRLETYIPRDYTGWIVIDEVQRIPELLNEVHRLIEKRKFRFILTGSSARKLRRGGANLLAGRALTLHLYPLVVEEIAAQFDFEKSLKVGHLPQAQLLDDPEHYLESYVNTYLREEVMAEGLSRNLSAFSRFLEAASFSQGSVLNTSKVAEDCGIERKTVANYFDVLEDLLIARRLPVFTKRAKRKTVSHPKFYFFDVGVYRTLRPRGPLDSPEEIEGAAAETLVMQEIVGIINNLRLKSELFYWRTQQRLEVDFVVYGEKTIVAIEVKRSQRIRDEDLKGLRAFKDDYKMARCFLFYGGSVELNLDGITAIPLASALGRLPEILTSTA